MQNFKTIARIAMSGLVLATTISTSAGAAILTAQAASAMPPHDQVLRVDATGKALLRGTIETVSNGTLTVKGWGGEWTVNTSAATEALPRITGNDLANFEAGDYVGVQGTVREDAVRTIDATLVRDWTYRETISVTQKQNRASASATIKSGTAHNYVGIASGLNGDSFTLTPNGATSTLTVAVAGDAEIVNRNWIALPLTGMSAGDVVRVWGINTGGTVDAKIVRDISVPATSTASTGQ